MDRRDTMGGPYYTQRGMPGPQSLMHGSSMHHFQPNFAGAAGGSIVSTLQQEPPQPFSSSNAALPSVLPVAPVEPVKRKRGRPRKYGGGGGGDGGVSLGLSPASISPSSGSMGSAQKRGRGRPPGSGRKQQLASSGVWQSGTAGMGFTPHIITVAAGEDVATKILAFSQQGQRAICILSAMGSVSTVTLRQPSSSGGSVTYEGRFEILCLSGSYLQSDTSGSRNRTGGLSISLASPDGRVIGGGVGGMLIAAGPVQVIIGSFSWGSSKKSKKGDGSEGGRISSDNNNMMMQNMNSSPLGHSMSSLPIGIWRDSEPSNLPDVHVDIDLMRG